MSLQELLDLADKTISILRMRQQYNELMQVLYSSVLSY